MAKSVPEQGTQPRLSWDLSSLFYSALRSPNNLPSIFPVLVIYCLIMSYSKMCSLRQLQCVMESGIQEWLGKVVLARGSLGRWHSRCQPGLQSSEAWLEHPPSSSLTALMAGGFSFLPQGPLHSISWQFPPEGIIKRERQKLPSFKI